ncbi:MAG: MFS transporter [Chloroflexi bacterium]|nr:MFS transporter [Chloroflexota bacterium]MBI2980512.1 MFS transporter [Chloroflexota bacterium]
MVLESWRRNLYAIFVAELVVLTGFSFANPFMPLFIQELGNFTNEQAAFWGGIASGASGIAMFFSAPLWGIIADRWGRKPMVLRAIFGGSTVLALMGLSPNIYYLIGFRFAQGVLSGTVAAASALVAALTPRNKMPFAMGLITLAMFTGQTVGPFLGGFLADLYGYRTTFFITGALLFIGGLVVLFLVKENFQRPAGGHSASPGDIWRLATSKKIFPLLLVLGTLHIAPQMVSPIIPLFIRELDPEGAVATMAGLAFSFMGGVAILSTLAAGRLGERITMKKMLVFSCVVTGLLYLPPMWAGTVGQILIFIALSGLFKGGLMVASNALIGLSVPLTQQGLAYGLGQSANSLGNGLGPMIGGSLANLVGLRPVFGFAGLFFIAVGILAARLLTGQSSEKS